MELDAVERRAVLDHRRLVAVAAIEELEDALRQTALRHPPQVGDVVGAESVVHQLVACSPRRLMILPIRSISERITAAERSGVVPKISAPSPSRRDLTSGCWST